MKTESFIFRKATLKDIPQCERLVAHSDWQDFIRKYVKKRVDQSDKYLYVVCKNEKILGTGCITVLPEEMAWLEGIRVHDNYYQQGIGTALFDHGVDYAQENGSTRVLFGTWYHNKSAISIGKTLGFDRIADVDIVSGNPFTMKVHKEPGKEIPLDKAFKILKTIPQGPRHELCIGVNKVYPFSPELCEKENVHFYGTTKTIVLETDVKSEFFKEPIRDVVVYGLKDDVTALLEDVVRRAKRNGCERVRVLGSPSIILYGLALGFRYPMGERFGLAIFKKEL